ncbi:MAG: RNase adapter RapZ [Gallionella sp.]
MQLFLLSGLSGSGKSVALKGLEDSGFYCVDNLPTEMLTRLTDYLLNSGYDKIAVSIDVRSANSVQRLPEMLQQLKQKKLNVHLLFLDAKTDTLVQRFSETRRSHPLSDGVRTLPECVQYERELLAEINAIGHHIDTSDLKTNTLRTWIKQFITLDESHLTLSFESFGFKQGIPLDADFVFDIRCLPNPHYELALRPLTGQDGPVIDFLKNIPIVQAMFNDISSFVDRWLPHFILDNRNYLTIAIGCTGGQHRSVYITEKLAQHFQSRQQVLLRHRELS